MLEKINLKATPPVRGARGEGARGGARGAHRLCTRAVMNVQHVCPSGDAIRAAARRAFLKALWLDEFVEQLPISSDLSRCNCASATLTGRTGLFNFL